MTKSKTGHTHGHPITIGLVYWGLTPQQQQGSYQGGEMMMESVFWWHPITIDPSTYWCYVRNVTQHV